MIIWTTRPIITSTTARTAFFPLRFPSTYVKTQWQKSSTDGISYRTNTSNHTAIVSRYNGDNADVIVPAYISSGGTAYKVTGISSAAFAGKPVRSVKLGKYIDEIPAAAFEECSSLREIAGYFTKIGNSAFSGCTALRRFTVSSAV